MMRSYTCSALMFTLLMGAASNSFGAPFDSLQKGIREFDTTEIEAASAELFAHATRNADSFAAQWEAAETCRLHSAQLRETRLIVDDNSGKALKEKQLNLAKLGQAYAERALELARGDEKKANAHRVLGEVFSLQINGMVTGMRKGPKAKSQIQQALKIDPDLPESMRAIGLMYLHNPPISGGNVPKAIETFTACYELNSESAQYALLLAMALKKKGDKEAAMTWGEKAADLNPKNENVERFLSTLNATKGKRK